MKMQKHLWMNYKCKYGTQERMSNGRFFSAVCADRTNEKWLNIVVLI